MIIRVLIHGRGLSETGFSKSLVAGKYADDDF